MVKVQVTFNFDPTTETVTDVLCSVGETVSKTVTTKKATIKKVGKELEGLIIVREEGKLVLSPELIELLEPVEDEIRVSVRYEQVNSVISPFFGTDAAFKGKNGNKVTKGGTVAYRGKANEVLAEFGEHFTLTEYKPGIYQMIGDIEYVPKDVPVKKAVEKVKAIEVAGNEETVLTEMTNFTF
jgi:hypothetical protein